jgi:hypothetical protein
MSDDINDERYKAVRRRIMGWETYRKKVPLPQRNMDLKDDLYAIRNGKGIYPDGLIDADDEINAAVEHYFLCRAWVSNREYPVWQVEALVAVYNAGKDWGVTPRHNPDKPTTPASDMQKYFQRQGIIDGTDDAVLYNGGTAWVPGIPPMYY